MNWENLKIKTPLINNLNKQKLMKPLPIQEKVIPAILTGKNLIVSSPTGSGKTHAFLISILNQIDEKNNKTQAIIFSPTRELAQQIYEFAKTLVVNTAIKVTCFTGGKDIKQQTSKFNHNEPHLIIGTIARIKTFYNNNLLKLTAINTIVIDECDMIFEAGFFEDLHYLLQNLPTNKQIIVFSATIKQELQVLLKKYLQKITIINLNIKATQPKINHIFIKCPEDAKYETLKLLASIINPYLCVIFVNSQKQIAEIATLLKNENKSFTFLHGDMNIRVRNQIIKKIKNLDFQYLIATDIFARGIDIVGISDIISLNLPYQLEYYQHRAGRTARNNNEGNSYVLYNESNNQQIRQLQKARIKINYYKIKNKQLIPITNTLNINKNKLLNHKQKRIINQFNKKKVKPAYRQKLKKLLKNKY